MGVGGSEIPASMFQAANSIYILLFGLVFTAGWSFLAARGLEPSTPVKFALGIAQLASALSCCGTGAIRGRWPRDRVDVVAAGWHPVSYHGRIVLVADWVVDGHEAVAQASGKHGDGSLVRWVRAGQYAIRRDCQIHGLGGDDSGPQVVPLPVDTVHIYGNVFGQIAVAAFITAAVCLALSPLLTQWMHSEADQQ